MNEKSFFSKLGPTARAYTMIIALLIIWVTFTIITQGTFLSPRNLSNLTRQMSITAILATGMVLVIVSGNIDLSVGAAAGLCGAIAAMLQVYCNWGTVPSILMALLAGVGIGCWQGFCVSFLRVPAFIVTLGGMLIFRGALIGLSKGVTVAPLADNFRAIGQAFVPKSVSIILAVITIIGYIYLTIKKRASRKKYGLPLTNAALEIFKVIFFSALIMIFVFVMNAYEGIPLPAILVLIFGIIFVIISKNTKFGRYVYAVGGNVDAARLSGVNVRQINFIVFVIMGIMSAVAGIVLTARLDAATGSAGNMFELDAIAACVIGGTSLMGGRGSIFGAVIGALVMASLDNGMSLMNTEAFWQQIVKGLVLIIAVWIDMSGRK